MMNPKFKQWLTLSAVIHENVPRLPTISCPGCSSSHIKFEYIGDIEKRQGYFLLWCEDCLEGIHISRINIPDKAKVIPFNASHEQIVHIPNFKRIEYDENFKRK